MSFRIPLGIRHCAARENIVADVFSRFLLGGKVFPGEHNQLKINRLTKDPDPSILGELSNLGPKQRDAPL